MAAAAPTSPPPAKRPGIIERGALYTLDEVKLRTGWSKHALRTARRVGLVVRYFGNRAFISGDSICDFVAQHGKDSQAG